MRTGLKRVLQLRAFQEELARSELETETARLRALERSSGDAADEARASRSRLFAALSRLLERGATSSGKAEAAGERSELAHTVEADWGALELKSRDERLVEDWVWQQAVSRRELAEAEQPEQATRVERARECFFANRRGRMEVESLVEAAARLKREREQRREQRELDDWYQARLQGDARRTGIDE